jgi:hypothetical protein
MILKGLFWSPVSVQPDVIGSQLEEDIIRMLLFQGGASGLQKP